MHAKTSTSTRVFKYKFLFKGCFEVHEYYTGYCRELLRLYLISARMILYPVSIELSLLYSYCSLEIALPLSRNLVYSTCQQIRKKFIQQTLLFAILHHNDGWLRSPLPSRIISTVLRHRTESSSKQTSLLDKAVQNAVSPRIALTGSLPILSETLRSSMQKIPSSCSVASSLSAYYRRARW